MAAAKGVDVYVRDAGQLRELVARISGAPAIAIDTEFMREKTYWAKLCLVQVATPELSAIIDPLAVEDLSPLYPLLHDEAVLKVLHSGQQDLEIIYRLTGAPAKPVFDTQIAATLAGFPQQVGYASLVKELVGVELDKSDTYTDWAKRPLSETQVEYALNDVRYLVDVHAILDANLRQAGRLPWLEADFERLALPQSYEIDPDELFRRLKKVSSLNRRQLAIVQKVTAWREREAQRRDIPRRWTVGDESLIEIARRAPANERELLAIRGVKDKLARASYAGVLAAVAEGRAVADEDLPRLQKRARRAVDIDGAVDLMISLVRLRAKEHGVALQLLASRDEMEQLASGERDASPLLQGWRAKLIGDELVELLEGRISLSVRSGRLSVVHAASDPE